MHFGIVAVRAQRDALVDAFAAAWPHHGCRARVTLAGLEALSDWMRATQRQAAEAREPVDVFGFWQDGEWAVMFDPSYAQASDRRALATLSERCGLVLSFVVETAGGCAFFEAFDGGRLLRRIQSIDGALQAEGARLPQEAGLPEDHYFEDETRRLQRAFGLAGITAKQFPGEYEAIARNEFGFDDGLTITAVFPGSPAEITSNFISPALPVDLITTKHLPCQALRCGSWQLSKLRGLALPTPAIVPGPWTLKCTRFSARGFTLPLASVSSTVT